jgi:hypothetical protein
VRCPGVDCRIDCQIRWQNGIKAGVVFLRLAANCKAGGIQQSLSLARQAEYNLKVMIVRFTMEVLKIHWRTFTFVVVCKAWAYNLQCYVNAALKKRQITN